MSSICLVVTIYSSIVSSVCLVIAN
jgi:hypothetical protein